MDIHYNMDIKEGIIMAAGALALVNADVSLGLQLAGVVVPLIKGAITDIKSIMTPQGTVEYTVVITSDQKELSAIAQVSLADLVAINAQLKAQKAALLDIPKTAPSIG
jgi:hypothetical protein